MAALLLHKLVGIWQTTRDDTEATTVLPEEADPAQAVETVLLRACCGQQHGPPSMVTLPALNDAGRDLAATPEWMEALAES
eukprot:3948693-Prorocentrum_lima.AAC.1